MCKRLGNNLANLCLTETPTSYPWAWTKNKRENYTEYRPLLGLIGYCVRRRVWNTGLTYLAAEVFANTHAKRICEYVAEPQHKNHRYRQMSSCSYRRDHVTVVLGPQVTWQSE